MESDSEATPEEKIVRIFKLRKSPHISPQMIRGYLTETQLRTGFPREQIISSILDVTSSKNYASVYPEVWSINSPNIKREDLLDFYISDCQRHSKLNELIRPKTPGCVRFCSYNVHFFSWPGSSKDVEEFTNIEGVLSAIDLIQPDILGLQEALLPYVIGDELEIDVSRQHAGYLKDIQTNPSAKISDIPLDQRKIISEDDWEMDDLFEMFEDRDYGYRSQCMGSSTHSRERTYFGNILLSKLAMQRAGGLTLEPSIFKGNEHGRCATFGYFEEHDLVVCTLHLDVFDESGKTRLKEIKQVIDYLNRSASGKPTIIMGDFNSLLNSDYTDQEIQWLARNNQSHPLDFQVAEALQNAGFADVFGTGSFKYSTWSARRIDFIFVRNIGLEQIKATGVAYTPASDHLPIYVDIELR